MIYLKLLLIAVVTTYCIDTSGGWNGISSAIVRMLTHGRQDHPLDIKPFGCAQCMTFWLCLAYLAIAGRLTLETMAGACLASHLTINIAQAFDLINHLLTKLYKHGIKQRTN